jgi:subtilisin family serine protease
MWRKSHVQFLKGESGGKAANLLINHVAMKQVFFSLFLFCVCSVQAQETYMYRLILKDKGNPPFSLNHPEVFLSQKSIDRRVRQGLTVDSIDMPFDPVYFEAIQNTGATIRTYSKWVKTVVVHLPDIQIVSELEKLSFVDSLYCVWKGVLPETVSLGVEAGNEESVIFRSENEENYGAGFDQISMNNGHLLHNAGFYGRGISIAVIDGGFLNVDVIDYFDQNKIIEVKNFNHEIDDPLRTGAVDHGTRVLSCMLSGKPGAMLGTAPQANYYLFRSEVSPEEFPVEEDYWIAALEYADSLGIDIATTSLGYATFDDSAMNHTHSQLDGKTVPMSQAASLAASRGMLLFQSAGNEGNKSWGKIMIPADADQVITVGSVTPDSARATFSSVGLTADDRIKPDLMAMGSNVNVVTDEGRVIVSNGTSFSTPILAGLGACLWEAFPNLTALEMIKLFRESGNRFQHPDASYGYGIADVYKAYTNIKTGIGKPVEEAKQPAMNVYENRLYLNMNGDKYAKCVLNIYSVMGIRRLSVSGFSGSVDVSSFSKGVYIAHLRIGDKRYVQKIVKL